MQTFEAPPHPKTHYLSPGSMREGIAVCEYMVEPVEAAWQRFTTETADVTCRVCKTWIATQTVRLLEGDTREPKYISERGRWGP